MVKLWTLWPAQTPIIHVMYINMYTRSVLMYETIVHMKCMGHKIT